MFEPNLDRWQLVPDGQPFVSLSSTLLPVLRAGQPAILKVTAEVEERWGATLMVWWDGDGAARVLEHEEGALLMERVIGDDSLIAMARSGRDDEASGIICEVAARLHAPRDLPPPPLIPLPRWFQELAPAAERFGGILRQSAATADELLAGQRDISVLHGDLHHGNVLDGGSRGWLAIDPKRLVGERGFDFANIFCSPDLETATAPGRLARQAHVVAEAAGLERERLLTWILAYAGLSAAWTLGDGDDATLALTVAEIAAAELAVTATDAV